MLGPDAGQTLLVTPKNMELQSDCFTNTRQPVITVVVDGDNYTSDTNEGYPDNVKDGEPAMFTAYRRRRRKKRIRYARHLLNRRQLGNLAQILHLIMPLQCSNFLSLNCLIQLSLS